MMKAIGASVVAVLLLGCTSMTPGGSGNAAGPSARAELAPTAGNDAKGTVAFSRRGDRVAIVAEVSGLTPGNHGFHIHEKGDCSAPDGTSAGGHFNPGGKPHGDPKGSEHHLGDMPALVAEASGVARLETEIDASIGSGATDILGKAVVVHKDPDDFKTQPTGNSGARIACGVIRAA